MRKLIALVLLGIFLVGCSSKTGVGKDTVTVSKTDGVSTSKTVTSDGLKIDQSILDELDILKEPYTIEAEPYTYTDIPDKDLLKKYFDLVKSEFNIDIKHPTFIDFKYRDGKLYFDKVIYYTLGGDINLYFGYNKIKDLELYYTTEEEKSKARKFLKLMNFPDNINITTDSQEIEISNTLYKYKIRGDRLIISTYEDQYKEVDLTIKDKILAMIPNFSKIPYTNLSKLDEYSIQLQYNEDGNLYSLRLDSDDLDITYEEGYIKIYYSFYLDEDTEILDIAKYMLNEHDLEKIENVGYKVKDKDIYVKLHSYIDKPEFSIEYKE